MGAMIAVVGPSGVGKDSLLAFAADALAGRDDIAFVRRVITRPGDAGGEAHIAATSDDFATMRAAGAFAVTWQAHGLCYGVPVETVDAVRAGQTLVVNGSRAALADFRAVYPCFQGIGITASRDCLARRLAARGREGAEDIAARLDRPEPPLPDGVSLYLIDNSGELADAGRRLAALIAEIADRTA
jgi:ribose 1,5-bisphosphokinase